MWGISAGIVQDTIAEDAKSTYAANLGLIYNKTGRFEEAAAEFEKAVLLRNKVPPVVHDNLGISA